MMMSWMGWIMAWLMVPLLFVVGLLVAIGVTAVAFLVTGKAQRHGRDHAGGARHADGPAPDATTPGDPPAPRPV